VRVRIFESKEKIFLKEKFDQESEMEGDRKLSKREFLKLNLEY